MSHFGALQGGGVDGERVRQALDKLVDDGYLRRVERTYGGGSSYMAIGMTQKGRDALAGGVALLGQRETEVSA